MRIPVSTQRTQARLTRQGGARHMARTPGHRLARDVGQNQHRTVQPRHGQFGDGCDVGPGPGLGIRILGDITPEKVAILQEVDYIFINGLKEKGLYDDVWQAGAMLLPIHSVGVMGDERTYEQVVALRAVTSVDGMTADWSKIPFKILERIANRIVNEVDLVNRVVYDITSKPPGTIEWE